MSITREELDALQTLINIGQSMCDTIETIHRNKIAMFDSDGGGPGFIVTPQEIAKHGAIVMMGSFRVDIEGWHRALVEVATRMSDLRVPDRPYRPDTTLPDGVLDDEGYREVKT